jgi:hypothetical protein
MKIGKNATAMGLALWIAVLVMSFSIATAEEGSVSFEITHHHVGISVPNAEESAAWYPKCSDSKL